MLSAGNVFGHEMRKKILLTGGSGFIGRNILEELCKKYEISAPKHAELELADSGAVETYLKVNDFDIVIHAANIGGNRKTNGIGGICEKNLRSFFNIARCKGHFGRMIQLGSGAEYDKGRPLKLVKETDFDSFVPTDEFGFYKYLCSKYITKEEGITCIRIFGCYGKYEDYEVRFISNAICKAVFGLPITITNKNVFFSYLYAKDLAKILDRFIEKSPTQKFYNVAPDSPVDLLSIAKKVIQVSGKNLKIILKNEGLGPEYSADNSLLRKELPHFKFTSLEDGVQELYNWYSLNKGKLDKRKLEADRY